MSNEPCEDCGYLPCVCDTPIDPDESYICPDCAGSGEGMFGPPGEGCCRRCRGGGEIRDCDDDDGDRADWEYERMRDRDLEDSW
jgi:hypothetical protein